MNPNLHSMARSVQQAVMTAPTTTITAAADAARRRSTSLADALARAVPSPRPVAAPAMG